jgi:1,4-dihydroxy-2-naphthoate octaprenyltransferase
LRSIGGWIRASRFASQSYIAPPLLFGQACHFAQTGTLSWTLLVLVQLFGLFDQLFIVYANDYADQETDKLNRTATPFSGGSRVLVDGLLEPRQLKVAAWWMAGGCAILALALGLAAGRWLLLPMVAVALLLLWAYSYRPLRLSYRGGGELLQMAGVGALLPMIGYYAQAGSLASFPWPFLVVLLPTHLACAVATSLPDEPSDRSSRKRTAAVLLGGRNARLLVVALNFVSLGALTRVSGLVFANGYVLAILLVPTLANLAQLALAGSEPGSRQLLARVSLAILVTVSLVVQMSVVLFVA